MIISTQFIESIIQQTQTQAQTNNKQKTSQNKEKKNRIITTYEI